MLVNPLVYASEGLRGTLVPKFPHLSAIAVLIALVVFDLLLPLAGLRQFQQNRLSSYKRLDWKKEEVRGRRALDDCIARLARDPDRGRPGLHIPKAGA